MSTNLSSSAQDKNAQWRILVSIRNTIGLTSDEKVFLYNIASHQKFVEFGARALVKQRTGLTEWKFRKARKRLIQLGLIKAVRRPGSSTRYELQPAAVRRYVKSESLTLVTNNAPSRTQQVSPAGSRQGGHGGQLHQKNKPEGTTEDIQKNKKMHDDTKPRRTIVLVRQKDGSLKAKRPAVPERLATSDRPDRDEEDLDLFG